MDKNKFAAAVVATTIAGTITVFSLRVTSKCFANVLDEIIIALKK